MTIALFLIQELAKAFPEMPLNAAVNFAGQTATRLEKNFTSPAPQDIVKIVPFSLDEAPPEIDPPMKSKPTPQKRHEDAGLTDKQINTLKAIIQIQTLGRVPTIKTISDLCKIEETQAQYLTKALLQKDYIQHNGKDGKSIIFKALKDMNGKPVPPSKSVMIDGVKVTQCPPGHAAGYGINKPSLEA